MRNAATQQNTIERVAHAAINAACYGSAIMLILGTLILCCDSARAETVGCFKLKGRSACADIRFKCGSVPYKDADQQAREYVRNYERFGAVVARMCDDLGWLSDQAIRDGAEIQRLKKLAQRRGVPRNLRNFVKND